MELNVDEALRYLGIGDKQPSPFERVWLLSQTS